MRKTLLNIGNSYLFTGIVVAIDKDFGYEVLDDEWSADDGTQPHAVTGVENEDYVIASSAQTVAYNPWGKVSGISEGDDLRNYMNYYNEFTDYDCNGNVTRLLRGGLTNNLNGTFGLVDNLWMTYEGNRLVSVRDSAFHFTYANATDFDGVRGQEYPLTYDNAGALVSDAGRGIARTDYDLCGNPVRIQFTDGSVTRYIYSAAGEKLRVTYLTAVPNITVPIGGTRELSPSEILSADSTDYLLGGTLTMRNGRIDKYLFDEGYCQAVKVPFNPGQDSFTFYYYDRDHLGSVRQVIEAEGTDQGTVVQKMSYYPSGLQLCDNTTDSDVQPNRYNGKELDKMHGLNTYDYGARQYNPVTARWDRVDPLCEKYYSVSPYAYCGGNPMKYVDPIGKYPVIHITNQQTGFYAAQRVLGYNYSDNTQYTFVPLYRVVVTDTEQDDFRMEFSVTRDAFATTGVDDAGNIVMENLAFEPKDDNNLYQAEVLNYPHGEDDVALKLYEKGSQSLHAESNMTSYNMGYRSNPSVANGIMLHVGGRHRQGC